MKNAVHAVFLLNWPLYLSKEGNRSVDSLGWADDADADVLPTRSVSFAVRAEGSNSSPGVNAPLLVSEQKFRFRQIGTREPLSALRKQGLQWHGAEHSSFRERFRPRGLPPRSRFLLYTQSRFPLQRVQAGEQPRRPEPQPPSA